MGQAAQDGFAGGMRRDELEAVEAWHVERGQPRMPNAEFC